jgi:cytochrome c
MKLGLSILILTCGALLARDDSNSRGQQIFNRQCSKCHALDNDKEGPRLRGVYGRAAGSVSSFQYSDALKNSHITWSDETLDKWLADPSAYVPDTYMAFHLSNKRDRQAVIDYLRTLSGK